MSTVAAPQGIIPRSVSQPLASTRFCTPLLLRTSCARPRFQAGHALYKRYKLCMFQCALCVVLGRQAARVQRAALASIGGGSASCPAILAGPGSGGISGSGGVSSIPSRAHPIGHGNKRKGLQHGPDQQDFHLGPKLVARGAVHQEHAVRLQGHTVQGERQGRRGRQAQVWRGQVHAHAWAGAKQTDAHAHAQVGQRLGLVRCSSSCTTLWAGAAQAATHVHGEGALPPPHRHVLQAGQEQKHDEREESPLHA
jgi:hypothetical protein